MGALELLPCPRILRVDDDAEQVKIWQACRALQLSQLKRNRLFCPMTVLDSNQPVRRVSDVKILLARNRFPRRHRSESMGNFDLFVRR
jgi:hypothetical protein